jgi:hypothetical protein
MSALYNDNLSQYCLYYKFLDAKSVIVLVPLINKAFL